jgi:ferrous-iron efflux pump FieF
MGSDPVFALAIAGYILFSAWRIGLESFHLLMDRELSPEMRETILEAALSHEDVLGVHDLRTRRSGQTAFVQLHLELDGNLQLHRAHAIADEVDARILAVLPGAEILIHKDPAEPGT